MRRVNLYEIHFEYIAAGCWGPAKSMVSVAAETAEGAVRFLENHPDYPYCQILKLVLLQEHILVPPKVG